jgi:hypothetical protein
MIQIFHHCVEKDESQLHFWRDTLIGHLFHQSKYSTNQKQMSLDQFRKSLYYEKEDEVKQFLIKYDINRPEDKLGCVSDTLWFIISGSK